MREGIVYQVFHCFRLIKQYKTYRGLSKFLTRTARAGTDDQLTVTFNLPGQYKVIPVNFSRTETSCGWSAEPEGIPYGVARIHSSVIHNRDSKLTKALSYGEQR